MVKTCIVLYDTLKLYLCRALHPLSNFESLENYEASDEIKREYKPMAVVSATIKSSTVSFSISEVVRLRTVDVGFDVG